MKEKLKAVRGADELRTLAALAQRRDATSASAKMMIIWGLKRERIKAILSHLEAESVPQTRFSGDQ